MCIDTKVAVQLHVFIMNWCKRGQDFLVEYSVLLCVSLSVIRPSINQQTMHFIRNKKETNWDYLVYIWPPIFESNRNSF